MEISFRADFFRLFIKYESKCFRAWTAVENPTIIKMPARRNERKVGKTNEQRSHGFLQQTEKLQKRRLRQLQESKSESAEKTSQRLIDLV